MTNSYIEYQNCLHKKSIEVYVGNIALGGNNPIRIQSMTNTDTLDTLATVAQIVRLADVGCEFVRMAVQGTREAENLYSIKNELLKRNCSIPLVADIHYVPKAAEIAAGIVEKVRVNPGNYVDKNKGKINFTEQEYNNDLQRIAERMQTLIEICKKHNTAMRIGTNHGSLSDRILDRYGDTPVGMVASAMEFIKVCRSFDYHALVLSMKASNVKVMVQSTRLLVAQMIKENMYYPIHLGVTEAGAGNDGRIKSAAGIGCLLNDGIGDTLRVSLTEDPEKEIPVAKQIASYFKKEERLNENAKTIVPVNPFAYSKRETVAVENIGGKYPPIVLSSEKKKQADYFWFDKQTISNVKGELFPVFEKAEQILVPEKISSKLNFFKIDTINPSEIKKLQSVTIPLVLLTCFSELTIKKEKQLFAFLIENNIKIPVVLQKEYQSETDFSLKGASDFAGLLTDGLGDGLFCNYSSNIVFDILQATGSRISKAEFISCPSCGRTRYNIQASLQEIKARMSHLKGVKIGVMGCVVNGPGEMADADYGYVGSGEGKITLYKGKTVIERNIDEIVAIEALIELVKANGDWINP